jgi:thiol-disulfide isomerase/thioredoxin
LMVALYLSQKRIMYEGFEGSQKSLVICKADWCGHCKKAAPEFQKLLGASPMTLKDGSKITVKILDADKDKSEIGKYKVRGYPTILIDNNGQTTEYPGERTASAVMEFLNSNY